MAHNTRQPRAIVGALGMVALVALMLAVPEAHSQRMAMRQTSQLELLAPPPLPFPRTGAFIVRSAPAPADGNHDPGAVRLVRRGGSEVALEVEEIAPGLHRVGAPEGAELPLGTFDLTGVAGAPYTIHMGGGRDGPPVAPVVQRAERSRRTVTRYVRGLGDRLFPLVKVTLHLDAVPEGAVGVIARWVDWHDVAGGLYGAWTRVSAGSTEVALICTAEEECGDAYGQIPRTNERGALHFVDAGGRLSPPSAHFVVPERTAAVGPN